MPRKQKRRTPPRARTAPQSVAVSGAAVPASVDEGPKQRPKVGGDQAMVRAVEMSLGPRAQVRRGSRIVLDSEDPSIPLAQVPHFIPDLIRVVVVGVLMMVLLQAGFLLIPLLR